MDVVERITALFTERGAEQYFGEPVSQLEHALQAANLAALHRAGNALVIAALLHDIGHLLHGRDETLAAAGIDARHENAAQGFLQQHFDHDVTEPIRLHVAAKRYLCAIDTGYARRLSPASQESLTLQGGPMGAAEQEGFESERYMLDAVALRHWDDSAKVPGLVSPPLSVYRARIERLIVHRSAI
jgi:[1-hydroxy-2-(trimethylamino)ethyl]phosphonate dioxygenase